MVLTGAAVVGGFSLHDSRVGSEFPQPSPRKFRPRNYFADVEFPHGNPRISVAFGGEDRIEGIVRAAVAGLDPMHGMGRFIRQGDSVLIKPNVGFDRPPHLGATTHPEVLRWVIRLCMESGASRVTIADNPIESPEACFRRSGILRVAESEGAQILWPDRNDIETVTLRDGAPDRRKGEILSRWPVFHRPLAQADKVIGVAPVKDHNLCGASMGLKNWYGLLGGRRNLLHQAIHEVISDLGLLISPTLVIADGTRVMMTSGPTGGRITDVKPGGLLGRPVIVASVDPVACDAWCYSNLMGRDPASLSYIDMARMKIAAEATTGSRRFGEGDWQAYERQGKIVTTQV